MIIINGFIRLKVFFKQKGICYVLLTSGTETVWLNFGSGSVVLKTANDGIVMIIQI